jgi:hypothetical protein
MNLLVARIGGCRLASPIVPVPDRTILLRIPKNYTWLPHHLLSYHSRRRIANSRRAVWASRVSVNPVRSITCAKIAPPTHQVRRDLRGALRLILVGYDGISAETFAEQSPIRVLSQMPNRDALAAGILRVAAELLKDSKGCLCLDLPAGPGMTHRVEGHAFQTYRLTGCATWRY